GFGPGEVVVAGDSAGGYLAFTTALSLAKSGLPEPAAVATVSPLTDVRPGRTRPDDDDCPMLPRASLLAMVRYRRRCHRRIAVDGTPVMTVAPLDEDLRRLPPVAIHVGGRDLRRGDGEAMAERVGAAGRPC